MSELLAPISPGEILQEKFLEPMKIGQNQLARDIDVPVSRIAEIIKGHRAITPDTALRFSRAFGTTAEFWLNLQNACDLRKIRNSTWPEIKPKIKKYVA